MLNAEERKGRTRSTHEGSEKCIRIWLDDVKLRCHLRDLGVQDNNIKQEEEEEEENSAYILANLGNTVCLKFDHSVLHAFII